MGRREGAYSHSVWKAPQKASLDVHKLALARIVSDHHCPRLPCHSATHSLENITDGRVEDEAVSVGLSSAESCDGCTRVGADQSVGGLKPWTEAVKQVDKHRKPCKRENRRESPTVPAGAASAWLGVHGLSNVARSRSTVLGGISHEQHRHMAKPTAPATKTRFVMKGAVVARRAFEISCNARLCGAVACTRVRRLRSTTAEAQCSVVAEARLCAAPLGPGARLFARSRVYRKECRHLNNLTVTLAQPWTAPTNKPVSDNKDFKVSFANSDSESCLAPPCQSE
jgi:hypothetical protein